MSTQEIRESIGDILPDADLSAEEFELAGRIEKQIDTLLRLGRRRVQERAASVHPRLHAQGFTVLTVIGRVDSIAQSDLGEEVGLDRAGLSKVVVNLQELGLIEQTQSPIDRRARVLRATPDGRARILKALGDRRATVWDNVKDWSRDDAEKLADLLTRYNAIRKL